jgi:hypothetical protein
MAESEKKSLKICFSGKKFISLHKITINNIYNTTMAQRVNAINKAFGNCIFINKDKACDIITEKIADYEVFTEKPEAIKMEHIDETHDRLCLAFSNGELDGIVTWGKTQNGLHHVFKKFEAK